MSLFLYIPLNDRAINYSLAAVWLPNSAKQFAKEGVEPSSQMVAALDCPPVNDKFTDPVIAWGNEAITYADAYKKDYDEDVNAIVPAALKPEYSKRGWKMYSYEA